MRTVTVTIHNNEHEYEAGTTYEQIVKDFQKDYDAKIDVFNPDELIKFPLYRMKQEAG